MWQRRSASDCCRARGAEGFRAAPQQRFSYVLPAAGVFLCYNETYSLRNTDSCAMRNSNSSVDTMRYLIAAVASLAFVSACSDHSTGPTQDGVGIIGTYHLATVQGEPTPATLTIPAAELQVVDGTLTLDINPKISEGAQPFTLELRWGSRLGSTINRVETTTRTGQWRLRSDNSVALISGYHPTIALGARWTDGDLRMDNFRFGGFPAVDFVFEK